VILYFAETSIQSSNPLQQPFSGFGKITDRSKKKTVTLKSMIYVQQAGFFLDHFCRMNSSRSLQDSSLNAPLRRRVKALQLLTVVEVIEDGEIPRERKMFSTAELKRNIPGAPF